MSQEKKEVNLVVEIIKMFIAGLILCEVLGFIGVPIWIIYGICIWLGFMWDKWFEGKPTWGKK